MQNQLLKFGAFGFSAVLTLSFFLRIFNYTPLGYVVAVCALAFYEGGAWAWLESMKKSREGQRAAAQLGLFVSGTLSLVSSLAEIIMYTGIGKELAGQTDLGSLSVIILGVAAATTAVCSAWHELENPQTKIKIQELEKQARLADLRTKQFNAALDAAEVEGLELIRANAPAFGATMAQAALTMTQREVNRVAQGAQAVIDNPPQRPAISQPNSGAGGYNYNFQATAAPAPDVRPAPRYAPSGPSTPHSAAYDDDSRYFDDTAQPTQHAAPAAQPTTPAEERETAEDANANTPKAAARPKAQGKKG